MADVTQVSIMNKALFMLGKPPVADLSDASLKQSAAATKLMGQMATSLAGVLTLHGWLDALTYVTLQPAVIANDSNWKYSTVYRLPADFVHLWEINTPDSLYPFWSGWADLVQYGIIAPVCSGAAWETGTIDTSSGAMDVLRCNLTDSVQLSYVRLCSYGALGQHLQDLVAYDLAKVGAFNVTGQNSLAQALDKGWEDARAKAISADGMQQGGQAPIAASIPAMIRDLSR